MSLQLGLFARPPRPGETKTRLIPELGAEGARALHEAFLDDIGATALRLREQRPQVQLVIYSAEGDPGDVLRERARRWGVPIVAQQGDGLGPRMAHALTTGIAEQGAAMLLGTDAPTLPLRVLLAAHDALLCHAAEGPPAEATGGAPCCFGPVADGGYILVGARGEVPVFDGVRFGTEHALADTLRVNGTRRVTRLEPWYDVDTPADLRLLSLHLGLDRSAAPASAALLEALGVPRRAAAGRGPFVSNLGVPPETC